MKKILSANIILVMLLLSFKFFVYASNTNVNIYVEVYEEFEQENNKEANNKQESDKSEEDIVEDDRKEEDNSSEDNSGDNDSGVHKPGDNGSEEDKLKEDEELEYYLKFENNDLTVDRAKELKLESNFEFNINDIVWTVSDAKLAKIIDGKIYPLNNGRITVTAEYMPLNLKATCNVDVNFVLNKLSLSISTNTYTSLKLEYEKQDNATHYEIQRSTKKNRGYKTIATTTATSYVDKKLKCGTTYYYRVRAINKENNIKGNYSSVVSKQVKPAKINIVNKQVKSYNSTYIKWDKVSGASGYRVYRSTSKNGKYVRLTTTIGSSYTDKYLTSGKTYYYKVRAYRWVNGVKVFGAYSDVFELTPFVSAPKIKVVQSGTNVKITINKVKNVTGYEIYKSLSKDGKYTKVATTKALEYKDSKIEYANEYYYKARTYVTVKGKKVYSNYTEAVNIKTYVPTPSINVIREDIKKIKISWNAITGCTGYEIYISEDGIDYNLLNEIRTYKTTDYNKSGLENNKKYYIKVRAYKTVNGEKIYSTYSSVKTCELNAFLTALKVKTNYNLRSKTSGSYKKIGVVKKNQIVLSYGMEGNYYKVKLNNKFGYIHKEYVAVYKDAKVLGLSNINQFSSSCGKILPTGCEVTSLAVVLKYLGFTSVTKNMLADKYLPVGKVGVTDPNVAFVGTPYSSKLYGCYAPVIVKTANNYFNAIGNNEYEVKNLTGMDIYELYKEIDKGNPLIMWITCGNPYYQCKWTLEAGTSTTKEGNDAYEFVWYGTQHCVAVAGYNKKKGTLIIADVGHSGELTEYSISSLKAGYNILGKQIVSIVKK